MTSGACECTWTNLMSARMTRLASNVVAVVIWWLYTEVSIPQDIKSASF